MFLSNQINSKVDYTCHSPRIKFLNISYGNPPYYAKDQIVYIVPYPKVIRNYILHKTMHNITDTS